MGRISVRAKVTATAVALIITSCGGNESVGSGRPQSPGTLPTIPRSTTSTSAPTPREAIPSQESFVVLQPGDDLQAAVDANPEGTVFRLEPGTYRQQSLRPKSYQVFIGSRSEDGERLSVLDGEGITAEAFDGLGARGVGIHGLVITGYPGSEYQDAAIDARHRGLQDVDSPEWTIEDNEVREASIGIAASTRAVVRNNYVHHNRRYGITGSGIGILIEGNELAFNRTDTDFSGGDSGATKFVLTDGLVLRENWVHDNQGNGLWVDINNINVVIEDNKVENNWWVGIFYEISYEGVIRNNQVSGNGRHNPNELAASGILVTNSRGVEVTDNQVSGNGLGIVGHQWNHPSDNIDNSAYYFPHVYGERVLAGLWVHDNRIEMKTGWSGISAATRHEQVFGAFGNRFEANDFEVPDPELDFFAWGGKRLDLSGWQAAGQS